MFFKRKEIDGRKTVIDIDGFYRESKSVPNGWCDVAGSDVTLVSAALFIEFGMKLSEVKQYIQLKKLGIHKSLMVEKARSIYKQQCWLISTIKSFIQW